MDDVDLDRSTVGAFLSRAWALTLRVLGPAWTLARQRPVDAIAVVVCTAAAGAIFLNALFLQNAPHPAPMMAGKPRPIAVPEATGSVVALPRARPMMAETTRPAAESGKPVGDVARPEAAPVRARPQNIAELTKPPVDTAKPEAAPARQRQQVVADIQRELARRGFFDGPTDGIHGPKTDAAIRDFEHAAKLKAGAQADEALLRVITRTPIQAVAATRVEPTPIRAEAAPKRPEPAPTRAEPTPMRPEPAMRGEAPPRPPAAIRTAAAAKSASSGRVVAVQRALADYGYGQLTPNGVLGPETKTAIERFERERKLPVTGQVSDRLTRELAAVTGRPLE
jgi:peptidoglycan hydrolase-like protein with peptidoglycan-binding domain